MANKCSHSFQGFAITVPSFLVIGFANEISTLYFGLILYALGQCDHVIIVCFYLTRYLKYMYCISQMVEQLIHFTVFVFAATALVVPCLTSAISSYGTVDQKGTVLGIFRSLGALARGGGPMFASSSMIIYL